MAHPGVPETEKGQDEQIQSENNVDCLFRRQGCGPERVCTSRTDRQRCLLRGCLGKIEEKVHPRAKKHRRYLGVAS